MWDDGFASWNKPFESRNAAIQVPRISWTYCSRRNLISKSQCMANGLLEWWRCAPWVVGVRLWRGHALLPMRPCGAPLVCACGLHFRRGRAPWVVRRCGRLCPYACCPEVSYLIERGHPLFLPLRRMSLDLFVSSLYQVATPLICTFICSMTCFFYHLTASYACPLALASPFPFPSPIYRVYLLSHAYHAPASLVSPASPACPFPLPVASIFLFLPSPSDFPRFSCPRTIVAMSRRIERVHSCWGCDQVKIFTASSSSGKAPGMRSARSRLENSSRCRTGGDSIPLDGEPVLHRPGGRGVCSGTTLQAQSPTFQKPETSLCSAMGASGGCAGGSPGLLLCGNAPPLGGASNWTLRNPETCCAFRGIPKIGGAGSRCRV